MLTQEKKNYLWNMAATLINASEAVIILMVSSRTVGLYDTGILTIAFSIANLMIIIGKFGMRNYQVTDVIGEYSEHNYYASRMITFVLMVGGFAIYMLWGGLLNDYSFRKVVIISGVFFMYASEVVEDVFWGVLQKEGRLDLGARMFCIRWLFTIVMCCIMMIHTEKTVISVWISALIGWLILLIQVILYKRIIFIGMKERRGSVSSLMRNCLPLALSSLLLYYITNSSRYAIDGIVSEEEQACYGFVAMPIFVIGLINMIMYQPILVTMATELENKELDSFISRIYKQILILAAFSLVCFIVAWFIGVQVLGIIYRTNLSDYRFELMILLLAGMWLAFSGFFATVLTLMRLIKIQMILFFVSAGVSLLFCRPATVLWGTRGACMVNMISTMLLAMVLGIILYRIVRYENYVTSNGKDEIF